MNYSNLLPDVIYLPVVVGGGKARGYGVERYVPGDPGWDAAAQRWLFRQYGIRSAVGEKEEARWVTIDERPVLIGGAPQGSGRSEGSGVGEGKPGKPVLDITSDPRLVVERLADAHEAEWGWDERRTREGFVRNHLDALEKAPVPDAFVQEMARDIAEQVAAGRAGALPVVIHGPREGYNDRWVGGMYEQYGGGFIRMLYQEEQRLHEIEPLGQKLATVSQAYGTRNGGTYVHEYGHHYAHQNPKILGRASLALDDESLRKFIKDNISRYAVVNNSELAAEAYTAWKHPDFGRLGEDVRRFILDILGEQ